MLSSLACPPFFEQHTGSMLLRDLKLVDATSAEFLSDKRTDFPLDAMREAAMMSCRSTKLLV
jgi:hypothetical protein